MELATLISMQARFDEEHGWSIEPTDADELLRALERELIGLLGEIGEIANCLKKIRLKKDAGQQIADDMNRMQPEVREELVDSFIYLVRLLGLTKTDIGAEYLRKMDVNRERYKQYRDAES